MRANQAGAMIFAAVAQFTEVADLLAHPALHTDIAGAVLFAPAAPIAELLRLRLYAASGAFVALAAIGAAAAVAAKLYTLRFPEPLAALVADNAGAVVVAGVALIAKVLCIVPSVAVTALPASTAGHALIAVGAYLHTRSNHTPAPSCISCARHNSSLVDCLVLWSYFTGGYCTNCMGLACKLLYCGAVGNIFQQDYLVNGTLEAKHVASVVNRFPNPRFHPGHGLLQRPVCATKQI
jgi:hypothetical protein